LDEAKETNITSDQMITSMKAQTDPLDLSEIRGTGRPIFLFPNGQFRKGKFGNATTHAATVAKALGLEWDEDGEDEEDRAR
ncbi:hypothetical protein, partial [Streptococcus pneumoniae]|uniref:hypothetical protein n=1 Tax=Streptococcus pneumoniae TaxID=1313 RepID=UPI0018B0C01B